MKMIKVIALDLEGTLISNAISQIPRPGLYKFLEGCKEITERIVIYTTVKEGLFRNIAELLVSEGDAPKWFTDIEYINWHGKTKNLIFIENSDVETSILIDDYPDYIHSGQEKRWIHIALFGAPYPETDIELERVLRKLKTM